MEADPGKGSTLPTLPPLRIDQEKPDTEDTRSERPSHLPVPRRATNVASCGQCGQSVNRSKHQSGQQSGHQQSGQHQSGHHRFLTPVEWARIAHAVGAIKEGETHTVVHPTSWLWAPKGMPDGLYKDVIIQRANSFYSYHILSTIRWFLMIFQIVLGACLTALGSMGFNYEIPVVTLAALNTVDAGVLALMHNSGIPERYRMNKLEYSKVEEYIREILDTGIVESSQTVDEVIADCFHRWRAARTTVQANMPDYYANNAPVLPSLAQNLGHPGPAVHEKTSTPAFSGHPPPTQHGMPKQESTATPVHQSPIPSHGNAANSDSPAFVASRHTGR